MIEIGKLALSAFLGGLAAYFGVVWQTQHGAKRYIHERVHDCRARLYPDAWTLTGLLPRRPEKALSFDNLEQFASDLEAWYYKEGGIYLSGGARRAYSLLQDELYRVKNARGDQLDLSSEQYKEVRESCSAFRTWLTKDLLSRRRAPTGKGRYKSDAANSARNVTGTNGTY